eukprot:sb/3468309/
MVSSLGIYITGGVIGMIGTLGNVSSLWINLQRRKNKQSRLLIPLNVTDLLISLMFVLNACMQLQDPKSEWADRVLLLSLQGALIVFNPISSVCTTVVCVVRLNLTGFYSFNEKIFWVMSILVYLVTGILPITALFLRSLAALYIVYLNGLCVIIVFITTLMLVVVLLNIPDTGQHVESWVVVIISFLFIIIEGIGFALFFNWSVDDSYALTGSVITFPALFWYLSIPLNSLINPVIQLLGVYLIPRIMPGNLEQNSEVVLESAL